MAFKGITVNTAPEESAHIYAQDDAAIYQSIFGGDGVLNTGNKFKATVLSNNSIRVSDGLMCIGGHIGRTEYGSYNDLTIQNGAAGYNRNDIIYARFITNGNIDTYALAVKKGTAAAGVAVDPVMIQGNLYEGEASREYPLWRGRLGGVSITKVEQMFRIIPTIPDLEAQYDALNEGLGGKTIAEAIRDLNTDLAAANTALQSKAPSDHNHDSRYYTESEVNNLLGSLGPFDPRTSKIVIDSGYMILEKGSRLAYKTVIFEKNIHQFMPFLIYNDSCFNCPVDLTSSINGKTVQVNLVSQDPAQAAYGYNIWYLATIDK